MTTPPENTSSPATADEEQAHGDAFRLYEQLHGAYLMLENQARLERNRAIEIMKQIQAAKENFARTGLPKGHDLDPDTLGLSPLAFTMLEAMSTFDGTKWVKG